MKRKELPQDKSALNGYTRELHYVKDEEGVYRTALSTGWEVKSSALNNAWDEINKEIEAARLSVINEVKSPIYYFMVKNLMNVSLLKSYTGFYKFQIRRHFNPKTFRKLSDKKLQKYAIVFNITVDELKNSIKKPTKHSD